VVETDFGYVTESDGEREAIGDSETDSLLDIDSNMDSDSVRLADKVIDLVGRCDTVNVNVDVRSDVNVGLAVRCNEGDVDNEFDI